MFKTKKKLLITIALLLIVTLGVSVAAYTIAGLGNGDSEKITSEVTQRTSKLSDILYKTNIDLIAEDSAQDGYCFNIVHMIPGSMASNDYSKNGIDTYVSSGKFKDMVINQYTTGDAKMGDGKVRVITFPVNSTVSQSTLAKDVVSLPGNYAASVESYDAATYTIASLLSDTDLLYIESPSASSYMGGSSMSDSLYSYIKNTYVGTNHKPIILDDIKNSTGGEISTDATYRTVINAISDRYLYSPVFSWEKTQSVESFLQGEGTSHFFAKTLKGKATGKILRIRNSSKTEVVSDGSGNVDIEASRGKALDLDWITNRIINADKSALYYGNIENYPGYDTWKAKLTQAQYDAGSDANLAAATAANSDSGQAAQNLQAAIANVTTCETAYNAAEQALTEAKTALDEAKNNNAADLPAKQAAYNTAKADRDAKFAAYEDAQNARDIAQAAKDDAQSAYDAAVQANTKRVQLEQNYNLMTNNWNTYSTSEAYYRGGLDVIKDEYKIQETEEEFLKNPAYYEVIDKESSALTTGDLSGTYDFIIIEDSVVGEPIATDIQSKIIGLANGTQYIIFDAANVDPKGNENTNTANKYVELYENLVTSTTNEPVNPERTLVVKNGFFTDSTEGALTEAGAKKIADILNGSSYRGSETNGRNGKKFKVLEIQPCYPIDEKQALANGDLPSNNRNYQAGVRGNYYQNPYDVLKKAPEQVGEDEDYYAFELSIARIAYATGLKYSQIELDQMSTEEFICRKDVVLDTYDLVYIGGDFSALVPHNLQNIFSAWQDNTPALAQAGLEASNKLATNFDMYTHTGGMVQLKEDLGKLYGTYYEGGTLDASIPADIGYGVFRTGGTAQPTATVYNGNDLTATKCKELMDFIDAGMPIIFGSDVTSAYEAIYDKSRMEQLANKLIDPTSNMYAVLDYAYKKCAPDKYSKIDASVANNAALKSIYWGMDVSKDENYKETSIVWEDNTDGKYGSTARYTRYKDDINTAILSCIEEATVRPTLQIRNAPKDYLLEDITTHYSAEDGKMTIQVGGLSNDNEHTNLNATLYVDKDGNGSFDSEEAVDSKEMISKGNAVDLVYEFEQSDFYGLVSWQVVATTEGTALTVPPCDVRTGFAYFKRPDDVEKKEVRTLQIMPLTDKSQKNDITRSSLYMCTECQWAKTRLDYNIYGDNGSDINTRILDSWDNGKNGTHSGIYLGKHEHSFGISKYNSNGRNQGGQDRDGEGSNNWNSNHADDIADDYDFSIDILYLDELKDISNIVKANGTKVYTKDEAGNDIVEYVPVKMLDANGNLNTNGVDRKDENGDAITATVATADMTWVEYYQALADKYYDLYEQAKEKTDKSDAKAGMIEILTNLKNEIPAGGALKNSSFPAAYISSPDDVQNWIDNETFSHYFVYVSNWANDQYATYYTQWARLHDDVVDYYNLYRKYSSYAATEDNWIGNNYDIVVLGFSESFNGQDLTVDECNQVKSYITNGGTVLLTHDTTSEYSEKGSVTLTTQLRRTFGLDRYHASVDLSKMPSGNTQVEVNYAKKTLYVTSPSCDQWNTQPQNNGNITYGPFLVTNKNTTVKIVKDTSNMTETSKTGIAHLYPVSSCTYDDNVSNDGRVTITVELYDTEADLQAGNLSTTWVQNTAVDIYNANSIYGATASIPTSSLTTGKGSVSIDAGKTSVNAKLKVPFFIFDNDKVGNRSKYYITPLAVEQKDDETLEERIIWQNDIDHIGGIADNATGSGESLKRISLVGITDSVGAFRADDNGFQTPYKYSKSNWYAIKSRPTTFDYHPSTIVGTDFAQQNNKGIVTTYPFGLGDRLRISPTHVQYLSADLEDSNMTVWYSLGATNNSSGTGDIEQTAEYKSAWYAATPRDGMDNYFIYTYHSGEGTVHYCGAGHSRVTGSGTFNDDERMLFMNIAVDSVRNSGSRPKITLYDKDHKEVTEKSKNGLKLDADGNYVYTLSDIGETPEFDFDVRFSELAGLADVYMFYDFNYDSKEQDYHPSVAGQEKKYTPTYSNKFTDDWNHVLIQHYTSDTSHKGSTVEKDASSNPNGCINFNTDDADKVKELKDNYQVELKNSNPLVTDKKNLLTAKVRNLIPGTTDRYTFEATDKNNTVLRVPKGKSKLALNVAKDTNDGDSAVDYFTPYNNYTYLVIYAKDKKGKTAQVRIKIMLTQRLFELTENTTIELPNYYFTGVKYTMDITDKTRFNI